MKILIIGSGGREHALAEAYSKSKRVEKVFVAPGNDLMSFKNTKISILPNVKVLDFEKILDSVKKLKIDLVDVAQDDPLAGGLVDVLNSKNIKAFGPFQKAAEIEWNKAWARIFMQKYKLPTPSFQYFNDEHEAIKYARSLPENILYIKAAGLAAGKGAIRAETKEEAILAIKKMKDFGKSGKTFLIEEALIGEEFSLFIVCDGKNYKIIRAAQDHKTVYEKDKGPNTGGMGCVSPIKIISSSLIKTIEKTIIKPFMIGMQKEERDYSGILYLGGIIDRNNKIKIIEFNARWGDPEAEVILPGIKTDYLKIVEAVLEKKLDKIKIEVDNKTRISIAGCSYGYPNDYSKVKGKEITGLKEVVKNGIKVFGAGIKIKNNKLYADGGRVFHLVSEGNNVQTARKKAYEAMSQIYIQGNNLHYRTDIGWRELERI